MRRASCIALFVLVGACRSKGGAVADRSDAGSTAPSAASSLAAQSDRGPALVTESCLACHSEEILRQQRLTPAQWEKVVKKMAGWGATVAADDLPIVSAYLATNYGTDAGRYEVGSIAATAAPDEIAPKEDGPFAEGSAERGGALYAARCASCHGADARGQIGVNLVDRPLLYRAASFATTLRSGRAKMPAQPETTNGEVADLLAHLRRLRPAQ